MPCNDEKQLCELSESGLFVADVKTGNYEEAMLAGPTSSTPSVQFGCSASKVFSDSDAVSTTCFKTGYSLDCLVVKLCLGM